MFNKEVFDNSLLYELLNSWFQEFQIFVDFLVIPIVLIEKPAKKSNKKTRFIWIKEFLKLCGEQLN